MTVARASQVPGEIRQQRGEAGDDAGAARERQAGARREAAAAERSNDRKHPVRQGIDREEQD
jgi:hypothetical protein